MTEGSLIIIPAHMLRVASCPRFPLRGHLRSRFVLKA